MNSNIEGRDAESRLASLGRRLFLDKLKGFSPVKTGEVNNHVHTIYSFSPYSPAQAAYNAWLAGLDAVGIVDHESVSGCGEMIEAARLIGIAATLGCELRADAAGTAIEGRLINNPDSAGIFYVVIHGIPRNALQEIDGYMAGIRLARRARSLRQVEGLNEILEASGIPRLDFNKDVAALSCADEGGSITERHILYALALRMKECYGRGARLVRAIESSFGIKVPTAIAMKLSDERNPHFAYDLLGFFKAHLLQRIFIQPDKGECPPVREIIKLAERAGAIACYPYLGDVGDSPTGDKKPRRYEDDWLGLLFDTITKLGFRALSYMPPRNSIEQLRRVREKCVEKGLMEISGVDINSSRQLFSCPELQRPEFAHLGDSTWALIAHEQISSHGGYGLFSSDSPLADSPLKTRLNVYVRLGRGMDPFKPESIMINAKKEGLCG
ncbi:MAG: hypothetical protein B6D68_02075 [spirochete symbiont of Stewartia floridana]|nr:MAG: hypothetical protein B6D68_02075 [spirochete symbiont of Stewartia floridana]